MWMSELAMNTSTAESAIGRSSDSTETIRVLLRCGY
jgi:hypothetical protein